MNPSMYLGRRVGRVRLADTPFFIFGVMAYTRHYCLAGVGLRGVISVYDYIDYFALCRWPPIGVGADSHFLRSGGHYDDIW